MAKCCADKCGTTSCDPIQQYRFPEDPMLRLKWVIRVGNYILLHDFGDLHKKSIFLCSKHFHSDHINKDKSLKPNTEPLLLQRGTATKTYHPQPIRSPSIIGAKRPRHTSPDKQGDGVVASASLQQNAKRVVLPSGKENKTASSAGLKIVVVNSASQSSQIIPNPPSGTGVILPGDKSNTPQKVFTVYEPVSEETAKAKKLAISAIKTTSGIKIVQELRHVKRLNKTSANNILRKFKVIQPKPNVSPTVDTSSIISEKGAPITYELETANISNEKASTTFENEALITRETSNISNEKTSTTSEQLKLESTTSHKIPSLTSVKEAVRLEGKQPEVIELD